MDEDLSIIKTETRKEKIKKFFINNKKKLITSVILILFTFVSFFVFTEYQNIKKKKFQISTIQF